MKEGAIENMDDLAREAYRQWGPFEFDRLRRDGVDITSRRSWRFSFTASASASLDHLIEDLPSDLSIHPIEPVETATGHVLQELIVDEIAAFTCDQYIERAIHFEGIAREHHCNFGFGCEFATTNKENGQQEGRS